MEERVALRVDEDVSLPILADELHSTTGVDSILRIGACISLDCGTDGRHCSVKEERRDLERRLKALSAGQFPKKFQAVPVALRAHSCLYCNGT